MLKNYFGEYAYVSTPQQGGIVELERISARDILEDIGWMRDYKVFELMEAKGKIVFHLDYHLERLNSSLAKAGLPLDQQYRKFRFLEETIAKILELNNFPASLVWIYVSGGYTRDGFSPCALPNLYILASRFCRPALKKGEGLRLKTVCHERPEPLIKNTNYFEAEKLLFPSALFVMGYDDVLYCDIPGPGEKNALDREISEVSRANFFIVNKKGVVATPAPGVLMGVTRKVVLDLARRRKDFQAEARFILLKDVMEAREAFITNTTKGVWPVVAVDEKRFEVGPITLKLRELFDKYRSEYFKSCQK